MTAVLLVNRSHTKAVIMENNLEKAEAESRAKGDFLSRMSHEIRTPMNAVMGLTDLTLMKNNMPEDVRENLIKIQSSSRYLRDLINDILDMNRLDSGMLSIAREPFSLGQLLDELQGMMENEAKRRGLSYTLEQDITHNDLTGDVIRLRQVLTNLLSNAVKYTPDGGCVGCGSGRYRLLPRAGDNMSLLSLTTELGCLKISCPHVFEPFSRAEGVQANQIQGTGLGMAITQNIVRMMNGTIEVKSVLGEGSQFIVAVSFELGSQAEEENAELSGLPVLVVDDDQIICESAAEILDELGMRSSWVLSGKEAVCRVVDAHEAKDDFFSVILDWKMPEMDGLEFISQMRKVYPDIPTVVLSGYDSFAYAKEAIHYGVSDYLLKPISQLDLSDTITRIFHEIEEKRKPGSRKRCCAGL